MATKYGENPLVVNCIGAHHDDVPHESEVSVLVQAADSISGSRPGPGVKHSRPTWKRLEGLERIARATRGRNALRDPGWPRDPRRGRAGRTWMTDA